MPRIKALKIFTAALLGVIVVRLFVVQVVQYDFWTKKADDAHTLVQTITAERGQIYMMDGSQPVAVVLNQTVYNVIIDPSFVDMDKLEATLKQYAPDYITADFDKLRETEGLRYYIVAKNVPKSIVEQMSKEKMSYVYYRSNNQRVYPEGRMASSLLGFVNVDGIGQYGVEGALNSRLAGTNGLLKTISDVNNVALSIGNENIKTPAIDGDDIVLTIERGLQEKVEESLINTVNTTVATNAAAVIMDSMTGEVYAMASVPNYDPANYSNVAKWSDYLNYTTEVPYEPASVIKTYAFAAALNEGVMTPESTYRNNGYEIIDTEKVSNASENTARGVINMRTAFNNSLNTGSIQALKWLGGDANKITQAGREKLYYYYHDLFGFGTKTGIEVAESAGNVHEPNYGWTPDLLYANMTFGQGATMTMIQVATAFSSVINGGHTIKPTILKGVMKDGGLVPEERGEFESKQVISEEVSAIMRGMLHDTRSSYLKKDPWGYYIGGKTGTGQVYLESTKAYSAPDGETIATYSGFVGPNGELPKYVIVVKMWGEGKHLAGSTDAKKAFDSLMDATIDYFKIEPRG